MGRRILVVDDDQEFLDEFCEVLRAAGFDTTGLSNPAQFLLAVQQEEPDLILMDMKMPLKTGFELLVSMDYYPKYHHIPVIVMSGHLGDENNYLFDRFNIKGFFKKPFSVNDVVSGINEALKESETS